MAFKVPIPPSAEDIKSHVWRLWFERLQEAFKSIFISVSEGGTGLTTLGTANQFLAVNGAGTALEYVDPPTSGKRVQTATNVTGTFNCNWDLYDDIRISPNSGSAITLTFSGGYDGQPCVLTVQGFTGYAINVNMPTSIRYNNYFPVHPWSTTAAAKDKAGYLRNVATNSYELVAFVQSIQ